LGILSLVVTACSSADDSGKSRRAADAGARSDAKEGEKDGGGDGSKSSHDGGAAARDGARDRDVPEGDGANGASKCGPLTLKGVWPLPAVAPSAVAVDGRGGVYVAGLFRGAVVFGTTMLQGPTDVGTGDMFLVKYDREGKVLYAKSYGTPTGAYDPPALAVDPSGDAFLGGAFSLTLDFGGSTTPLVALALDAFVAKISPSGDASWAERFGYDAGPYAVLSIAVGPDGNPVVAGVAAGTIAIGGTSWPAPVTGSQPFLAKLSRADGAVLWSNASGGDIDAREDVFVAIDASGRPFVAARVESGTGSWGPQLDSGPGSFGTLRAGFDASGAIVWGQFDDGAFPVSTAVDRAGRVAVLENAEGAVVVGGATTFGDAQSGFASLALLLSPVDGTLLSGLDIAGTVPSGAAVDGHGNTLLTGSYWPEITPVRVGGLALPNGGANQPLFLAALDGASHAVGVATLGASNDAEPLSIAVDSASGTTYVASTLRTAFTSTLGVLQPGPLLAVFGPDPCADDAGPLGSSTGQPSNHGDLLPDGGSVDVGVDGSGPAACPPSAAEAVNGAACPIAMGCTYDTTCCSCVPSPCDEELTTWACFSLGNIDACPSSAPSPGTACPSTDVGCNYCLPGGRLFVQCTPGGWETGYASALCE
jgi:hypothetical protein